MIVSHLLSPHFRNAVFNGGKRRKIGRRLGLVPVGDRKPVVAAVVGMAVLERMLQVALEGDGVVAVPAIAAIAPAGALRHHDERRAIEMVREGRGAVASAEIPAPEEIVLGPGADDGRPASRPVSTTGEPPS